MNVTQLISTTAGLLLIAGAAAAQAPPPAAPNAIAAAPPSGPAIPGVCVFSLEKTIAQSTVGKVFQTRMQQLSQQAQAELAPERAQLQTDAATLQGQQASLAPDVFQQRAAAMNQRIQAYSAKEQQRSQELDATQQKNLQRIAGEINPLLVSVYTAHNCSLVLSSEGIIAVNPAMDVSDDVTTQLNTRMTTITFDREHLDEPGAAGPAPSAAAAPAPRSAAAPARAAAPAAAKKK